MRGFFCKSVKARKSNTISQCYEIEILIKTLSANSGGFVVEYL